MKSEEEITKIVEEVADLLAGLSHWESTLVLEIAKQTMNALWLAESAKSGAFRDEDEKKGK